MWSLEGTGAARSLSSGSRVRYEEHDKLLPVNRYLLDTYNEPDPGDTSVNKASRLTELCKILPLAPLPGHAFLSPLAHYTSGALACLSILESIKTNAVLEISHSFFPLISIWLASLSSGSQLKCSGS